MQSLGTYVQHRVKLGWRRANYRCEGYIPLLPRRLRESGTGSKQLWLSNWAIFTTFLIVTSHLNRIIFIAPNERTKREKRTEK